LLYFFQEVARVGSVASETQFIIICFFLRQRFSALNDMLVQLKTVRTKPLLEHWLYQSSRKKGAMTRGSKCKVVYLSMGFNSCTTQW